MHNNNYHFSHRRTSNFNLSLFMQRFNTIKQEQFKRFLNLEGIKVVYLIQVEPEKQFLSLARAPGLEDVPFFGQFSMVWNILAVSKIEPRFFKWQPLWKIKAVNIQRLASSFLFARGNMIGCLDFESFWQALIKIKSNFSCVRSRAEAFIEPQDFQLLVPLFYNSFSQWLSDLSLEVAWLL